MVLKSEKRQRKILIIKWGKEVLLKKKKKKRQQMKKRKLWEETQQDSWPLRAALFVGSPGGPRHVCLGCSQDTGVD